MNNEDLLFSNKFITTLDTQDLSKGKVAVFRDYYQKKQETNVKKALVEKLNNVSEPEVKTVKKTKKAKKSIITIDSVDRDSYAFPLQNDFSIFLGKTFYNVEKIELISTEIPNTDTAIKSLPAQLRNNIVSWINEEDYSLNIYHEVSTFTSVPDTVDIQVVSGVSIGKDIDIIIFNSTGNVLDGRMRAVVISSNVIRILFKGGIISQGTCSVNLGYPIYSVNIVPGNYSAQSIVAQIQYQLCLVIRRNGEGQYHFFNLSLDINTNVITFESVITKQLVSNPVSTISGSTLITVTSLGHGFKTGDLCRMTNVQNVSGISGLLLSGDFYVIVTDFNTFTYQVNVPAISTTDGGGNNVRSGRAAPFKFLFQTEDTLIQYNIGFLNEDSSESIQSTNPITTKVITDILSVSKNGESIRITTNTPHQFEPANIIQISSIIRTGITEALITTSSPHLLQLPERVTIRNAVVNGEFLAVPNGKFTFIIKNARVIVSGTSGEVLYGGDSVKIKGLKTSPSIEGVPFFYVERIISTTVFETTFFTRSIDQLSVPKTIVETSQVFVNNPGHMFNDLSSISSVNTGVVSCKTFLPHNYIGSFNEGVQVVDGPITTNTIDLYLPNHGLETSDSITIINSMTDPDINGKYNIQVVSSDELRVNFVHASFVPGICTVITGNEISITESNSFPRIDGTYNIDNRLVISNLSSGTIYSDITTTKTHNWYVGDKITLTFTNSTPSLDSSFIIQSVISPTTVRVVTEFPVTNQGTFGIAVNNSRFKIQSPFLITTPGTSATIGRNKDLILYRILSDTLNGVSLGGIKLEELNGVLFKVARLVDTDNFMIRLSGSFATKNVVSGGSGVYISSINSGFRTAQSNTDTGVSSGQLSRSINLAGESYLYLCIPGISTNPGVTPLYTTGGIPDVFAKLLLSELPGLMVYNNYIAAPLVFSPLLSKIDTIRLKTLTRQGFPFNYNNIDYAFSLAITEIVETLEDSEISTRNGSRS